MLIRFLGGIMAREMVIILKCVTCEYEWTPRKSKLLKDIKCPHCRSDKIMMDVAYIEEEERG
jgi:predicted Zn-ribbon and HTH transcriptional regulator